MQHASIRCIANVIVTFNLKDCPVQALVQFGTEAIHPDDFIFYQIDMAPAACGKTIRSQRHALKTPEVDINTLLATFQK